MASAILYCLPNWIDATGWPVYRRNVGTIPIGIFPNIFGWMATQDFARSAPLPMPMLPETLRLGCDRIQQFADIAQIPVGLENLAFAFGLQDVRQQGEFLDQLLDPIDGFLLLDLHNLYCQMHNFQLSATEILSFYPLKRVRELHLSGGSWSQNGTATIRRDTHDQGGSRASL